MGIHSSHDTTSLGILYPSTGVIRCQLLQIFELEALSLKDIDLACGTWGYHCPSQGNSVAPCVWRAPTNQETLTRRYNISHIDLIYCCYESGYTVIFCPPRILSACTSRRPMLCSLLSRLTAAPSPPIHATSDNDYH